MQGYIFVQMCTMMTIEMYWFCCQFLSLDIVGYIGKSSLLVRDNCPDVFFMVLDGVSPHTVRRNDTARKVSDNTSASIWL